jgi:ABC-2 type transport system permease protein
MDVLQHASAKHYVTSQRQDNRAAKFEKKYKKYEDRMQPRVYDVKYDIDLYPETRTLHVEGKFYARNRYDRLLIPCLSIRRENGSSTCAIPGCRSCSTIPRSTLALVPLEACSGARRLHLAGIHHPFEPKGFENELSWGRIVQNGTFFDNTDIMPVLATRKAMN